MDPQQELFTALLLQLKEAFPGKVYEADLKWKLRWSNDVSIAKTAYSSAEILQNAIEIYL